MTLWIECLLVLAALVILALSVAEKGARLSAVFFAVSLWFLLTFTAAMLGFAHAWYAFLR